MTVERYLFQSPSPSQVQIGRPDPSVQTEENSAVDSAENLETTNESLQSAQFFESTQGSEVTVNVSSDQILDVYA